MCLALKQVRLDQPELPGGVQLAHHLEDLAEEETETSEEVASLELDGQAILEGGGQDALGLSPLLGAQLPQQLLLLNGILSQLLEWAGSEAKGHLFNDKWAWLKVTY